MPTTIKNGKSFLDLSTLIPACMKSIPLNTIASVPPASKILLQKLYQRMKGPNQLKNEFKSNQTDSEIKPPLIVSFHPKLSLLNNNVYESLLATQIAANSGQIPLWIPYVYDTATHSASEGGKIRAPTYAYIENDFIQLRAAAQIHGNIIKTEKAVSKKEIDDFFQALDNHLTRKLGTLQGHINPYNFGHALFGLKQKIMTTRTKAIKAELEQIKALMINSTKDAKNLGESLGNISLALFHTLGIPMNLVYIEHLISEIVQDVFGKIITRKEILEDPSLLEGMFVHYNIEKKTRTPIQFTGDRFIGLDENANRIFDGTLGDLTEGLRKNTILPTGPSLILMFMALGCHITIGGLHTQEYYPEYILKAKQLLENTGYNTEMKVIGYGDLKMIDSRSMTDIMATMRVLEKVGSRTIVQKQNITIPTDIVDHLNFLAGPTQVPQEYHALLASIQTEEDNLRTALVKEEERSKPILNWNKMTLDELKTHITELKPYFRQLNLESLHPERIKMAVETLANDTEVRLILMKENIKFEQHLLGGKIPLVAEKNMEEFNSQIEEEFGEKDKNTGFEEIYDGILIRSKRVPTLLELVLNKAKIDNPFPFPLEIVKSDLPDFLFFLKPAENRKKALDPISEQKFEDYMTAFQYFIPEKYLPHWFR